jgi:hypothetical protein
VEQELLIFPQIEGLESNMLLIYALALLCLFGLLKI